MRGKIADLILKTGKQPFKLTLFLSIPFVIILLALLIAIGVAQEINLKYQIEIQLKETAKAYFNQILVTRLWNAEHGGVYVEVTEKTKPNPYLLDDLERDIVSVAGKKYTKMNPAYMTKQISEISAKEGTIKFHITSLNPINPENMPDGWEKEAMLLFKSDKDESYEVTFMGDKEYFRYMSPLIMKEPCLKCHEKQGYKLGDVRGGISISLPIYLMKDLYGALSAHNIKVLAVIGFFSASLTIGIFWFFSMRLTESLNREVEAARLKAAIQLAGAAAHELRQPMSIISGFCEIIEDKVKEGESVISEADIIIGQCYRMNDIITRMLNITTYKTKSYDRNTEIFDLGTEDDNKSK